MGREGRINNLAGVNVAAIPLTMAYLSVWTILPLQRHPFYFPDSFELRRQDYKVLAAAFYSEEKFKNYDKEFWSALSRSSRRQGRLIAWYYPLVILEGLSFGWLATNYGKLKRNKIYSLLADRLLLPNISEWHVLLTAFVFPGNESYRHGRHLI